jgi:exodeoxyribonuclease VII small subunit
MDQPSMPAKKSSKEINFEQISTELESIVSKLEDDTAASLQTSLEAFESGIKLVREAQETLQRAEQKVQTLLEKNWEPEATELPINGVDE